MKFSTWVDFKVANGRDFVDYGFIGEYFSTQNLQIKTEMGHKITQKNRKSTQKRSCVLAQLQTF